MEPLQTRDHFSTATFSGPGAQSIDSLLFYHLYYGLHSTTTTATKTRPNCQNNLSAR